MSKRKSELRAMFAATPDTDVHGQPAMPAAKRPSSGAVKAMGLTLGSLAREADEAKRLRKSLEGSDRIVELDPNHIEASLVADRLEDVDGRDEAFEALKASILESGQQVPVLVRSHPDVQRAGQGWYQAAYGHRRIRAARDLGLPVKAIVKVLDDNDLLIAQGKENGERLDLSFIERAMFAQAIISGGFDRKTAQAALSVDKTEMSRMLQVAALVPDNIVRAIGPAPKIGRPRWLALGELVKSKAQRDKAKRLIKSDMFSAIDSNGRFQFILNGLAENQATQSKSNSLPIKDGAGRVIGTLTSAKQRTKLEFSGHDHAAFAAFVAKHLADLASSYASGDQEITDQ
ncbi:MAG: plasmid partitioning protein RepB [Pseudomonadota bacterium]